VTAAVRPTPLEPRPVVVMARGAECRTYLQHLAHEIIRYMDDNAHEQLIVIFYQQRFFAAISLVYASSPSAFHHQMYNFYIPGEYKGGGWSLVDLRNVGYYFLNRD
jgi:hypothetical protein